MLNSLLGGTVYSCELDGWQVSWESKNEYRHWCFQEKLGFSKNLLVIMFNPGSLRDDGKNLRKDTTLRILREVCEPAQFNIFILNLFDYAHPSASQIFLNWDKRDSDGLIYNRLDGFSFAARIMAYGDYENSGKYNEEIKERIALVQSTFSNIREIFLPKNKSGTPKHPIVWQRQRIKPDVVEYIKAIN